MRRQALAFLCASLGAHRIKVALALCVLATGASLEGIGLGLVMQVLQSLQGTGDTGVPFSGAVSRVFATAGIPLTFNTLVVALGAALVGRSLLEALYQHLGRALGATVTFDLRQRAFRNLMDLPLPFFYSQKTGDLIATLHTSAWQAGAAIELLLQATIGTLFVGVYVGLGLALSVPLTIAVLGLSALAHFLILPRFKVGFTQGQEEKAVIDRTASFLIDSLTGIKTVKTFHAEARHVAEFQQVAADFRRIVIQIQNNRILAGLSLEPAMTVVALVLVVVSVSVLRLPVAHLLAFFYIMSRTLPRIRAVSGQALEVLNMLPHILRVKALIDRTDKTYATPGSVAVQSLRDAIRFDNVTFHYPAARRAALDRVSVVFRKNQFTALIGGSGGGKTTLMNLLLKHLEPDGGTISVDGIPLAQARREDWHALVALVEQDPHLFNLTVFENIAYGKPGASEQEVVRAARLAHADEFIGSLPEGYRTHIGERGVTLSGGQRQRIALARALVGDPEVLILDEATSSLDTESERLIQASIEELSRSKTLITVAHRLSTIAKADYIYVLEHGLVVEEGRPADLLRDGGRYQTYRGLQLPG